MKVEWYDETHTIVFFELSEQWTWDEFHAARKQVNAMIVSQQGIIHCIADMRQNRMMPLTVVPNIQVAIKEVPTNAGYVIVIGADLLNVTLFGIVQRTFRPFSLLFQRAHMVRDMDEALEKLRQLPPLTP